MKTLMIMLFQVAAGTTPAPTPTPTPTGATTGTSASSAASLPVCLQRTVTDARGDKKPYLIAVGPSLATDLAAAGFAPAPCTGFRISAAQYRAEVCAAAASGNSAVQARREEVFGVAPKLLCEEATSLGQLLEQAFKPAG